MIIGLSGKRRSGKDTTANILTGNNNFYRAGFADPVKRGLAVMMGYDPDYFLNESIKEAYNEDYNLINRVGFQVLGTKIMREEFDKAIKAAGQKWIEPGTFWIKSMSVRLSKLNLNTNVVIPDVRFKNEADLIKSKGGILIRLDRPTFVRDQEIDLHISETDLDDYTGFDLTLKADTIDEVFANYTKYIVPMLHANASKSNILMDKEYD